MMDYCFNAEFREGNENFSADFGAVNETGTTDLTGYAKETWVEKNYAKREEIPTKPQDIGAQPAGNYLTTQDMSGYAKREEIPTKPQDIGAQPVGDYALKSEIPSVPVKSVNGKTGAVNLSASDVGARPSTWTPTYSDVGADPSGTAYTAVSTHNTNTEAHGDIRLELKAINDRLNAFFDSDDKTLDELSEIVAYITANKALIDAVTTSKVSVADIIDNLTTNVSSKPLSAAQGVVLKGLIDAVSGSLSNYALKSAIPTKVSQLANDKGYLTEHQDISGKLDAAALPTAINTALEQAKASGEFDGPPGDDGVSPTVSVGKSGKVTTVSITDKDGTKTATINDGADGTSVTVKSVSESGADGGSNVVAFSDGKTLTVKNGTQGSKGKPGLVWRGEYNSFHVYLIGDAVEYAGSSYVCVENNGGSEPSVSPSEALQTAWQLLASAGKNGNDYVLTDADKNKIVNAVIAALPVYAGEVL